jgi:hypothetical protein
VGDGEKLLTYLNSALKVLLATDIFFRVSKKKCYILFSSEKGKYTHFFTFNLAVTKKKPWVMEETTYMFEFSVKRTIRIRYFSSWDKKKVKFCWPVLLLKHTIFRLNNSQRLNVYVGLMMAIV